MDNIYNLRMEERTVRARRLMVVINRLPDGCFLKFKTSPSMDLINRLKVKIHSLPMVRT